MSRSGGPRKKSTGCPTDRSRRARGFGSGRHAARSNPEGAARFPPAERDVWPQKLKCPRPALWDEVDVDAAAEELDTGRVVRAVPAPFEDGLAGGQPRGQLDLEPELVQELLLGDVGDLEELHLVGLVRWEVPHRALGVPAVPANAWPCAAHRANGRRQPGLPSHSADRHKAPLSYHWAQVAALEMELPQAYPQPANPDARGSTDLRSR